MDGIYVPEDGSMFGLVAAAPGLPAREVLVRGRSSRTRPHSTLSKDDDKHWYTNLHARLRAHHDETPFPDPHPLY